MRLFVGFSAALLFCAASLSHAAEGDAVSSKKPLKVASAEVAKGAAPADAVAAQKPVTRSSVVVPAKPKRVRPTLVAKIDLTSQTMRVTSNGKVVGRWSISSGRSGYETPRGRFRPSWTSKMHYSKQYDDAPMPYSVFFNKGIATHGTTATGRLGRPASHGCIRLRTPHARKFFNLVHRHGHKRTRIIVTGRAKQTRTVSRTRARTQRKQIRSRSNSGRRNSFSSNTNVQWGQNYSGRRRFTVREYDRYRMHRHQQRVQRYYRSRYR